MLEDKQKAIHIMHETERECQIEFREHLSHFLHRICAIRVCCVVVTCTPRPGQMVLHNVGVIGSLEENISPDKSYEEVTAVFRPLLKV